MSDEEHNEPDQKEIEMAKDERKVPGQKELENVDFSSAEFFNGIGQPADEPRR